VVFGVRRALHGPKGVRAGWPVSAPKEVPADMGEPRRGRGRPHKPTVPVPSWPLITGELELPKNAFKRSGEVSRADYGRRPARPETFVYGR